MTELRRSTNSLNCWSVSVPDRILTSEDGADTGRMGGDDAKMSQVQQTFYIPPLNFNLVNSKVNDSSRAFMLRYSIQR